MKTFSLLFALVALTLSSGCLSFPDRGPQTPEDRATLIRSLVTSSTIAGLAAGFDEDESAERTEVAGEIIKWTTEAQNAIAEYDDGIKWDHLSLILTSAHPFLGESPPEVVAAYASAKSIFAIYVRPDETVVDVTSEQLLYVRAFLAGILEGARPFVLE